MSHLIRSYGLTSYHALLGDLRSAHGHLSRCTSTALGKIGQVPERWGAHLKRLKVEFGADRPPTIAKASERLGEVVNMAATLERMIDAVHWFSSQEEYAHLAVLECHPTTGSTEKGNDLVLGEGPTAPRVLVEVTDVVSDSAGQNGKELKDLASLGCDALVPQDGVRRYLCTSEEFAAALTSRDRKWGRYHYRYRVTPIGDAGTHLLEICQG